MSIGNYLTALDEQRDALARNLVTMGVQASESEKLNTLVPKVLQIPQTKPDITLFRASTDTLHDYGEKVYTFYNDGYRSYLATKNITKKDSIPSTMTVIAPLLASLNPTSISAARRTAMPSTTISRISTGGLSFIPCASSRFALPHRNPFCLLYIRCD